MHDFHPLHPDLQCRQQAIAHVKDTLMLAAQLHAPRIVTVCGFGHDLADRPFERSIEFFSSLVKSAKALGVRIMIEPLSPKRVGAMAHPEEVAQLVNDLNQSDVFSLLLDTGHLLDSGFCLNEFFSTWQHPIEELQLKGKSSAPPDLAWPLASWLDAMLSPPRIICVEHRQPVTWEGFDKIVNWLQQI
jgi:sugar phosphate isomerase/epimerase